MVLEVGFEPTDPKVAALQAVEPFVPDLLSSSVMVEVKRFELSISGLRNRRSTD